MHTDFLTYILSLSIFLTQSISLFLIFSLVMTHLQVIQACLHHRVRFLVYISSVNVVFNGQVRACVRASVCVCLFVCVCMCLCFRIWTSHWKLKDEINHDLSVLRHRIAAVHVLKEPIPLDIKREIAALNSKIDGFNILVPAALHMLRVREEVEWPSDTTSRTV